MKKRTGNGSVAAINPANGAAFRALAVKRSLFVNFPSVLCSCIQILKLISFLIRRHHFAGVAPFGCGASSGHMW
jgi:hypothetical protein